MINVRALPEPMSMLLTWIALGFLYMILRHFLYKPVSEFLNARKEKIELNIEEANNLKKEAESLKSDYASKINLAKKQGQDIIEGAKKRGEELKEGVLQEAKEEAKNIKDRAENEADMERKLALQDIKAQAGELAVLIASKIMNEELKTNTNRQKKLLDNFIAEVGNKEWEI